jgi:hypothetical protein
MRDDDAWPRLDVGEGVETRRALLLWGQMVGKTRLALAPAANHWWHVPFYVSARGLTTSAVPYGGGVFDVEIDLLRHRLVARTSSGGEGALPLCDRPLKDFYEDYLRLLRGLGIEVAIRPFAVEITESIHFDRDQLPCHYDPAWATRFFRALLQADRLLKEFRGEFVGKASPVHFFWGAFDLATSRFSGRTAPPHPGGIPHAADWVMREAYSHEVISAGFWPGDARSSEAAFYAYAYPEPPGFAQARVQPAAARYEADFGEFLLPWSQVRASADPASAVRAFLQTTYAAAAELAGWDRAALERPARAPTQPAS